MTGDDGRKLQLATSVANPDTTGKPYMTDRQARAALGSLAQDAQVTRMAGSRLTLTDVRGLAGVGFS
jgi:hypothetical protein